MGRPKGSHGGEQDFAEALRANILITVKDYSPWAFRTVGDSHISKMEACIDKTIKAALIRYLDGNEGS